MATFRVHFLITDPAGLNGSGPMPPTPLGPLKPHATHVRAACDPNILLSEYERGSGEPWAVYCDACVQTEEYKKAYYPHPNTVDGRAMHADGSQPGGSPRRVDPAVERAVAQNPAAKAGGCC
jgi:hypothetical protein